MDKDNNNKNKSIELSSIISLFLASATSYWFSDVWIDFGIATSTFWVLFLSLVGFILIPISFIIFSDEIDSVLSNNEDITIKQIILYSTTYIIFTLALLLTGKF